LDWIDALNTAPMRTAPAAPTAGTDAEGDRLAAFWPMVLTLPPPEERWNSVRKWRTCT